jgi:hypothetical protein
MTTSLVVVLSQPAGPMNGHWFPCNGCLLLAGCQRQEGTLDATAGSCRPLFSLIYLFDALQEWAYDNDSALKNIRQNRGTGMVK